MAHADDLVVRAERFATRWHAGQTDKLGAPYISHPRRVAARLTAPEQQVVAWLHDVLETRARPATTSSRPASHPTSSQRSRP
jgi:(p)ppGpp synthase/HD superfamily hydrolase